MLKLMLVLTMSIVGLLTVRQLDPLIDSALTSSGRYQLTSPVINPTAPVAGQPLRIETQMVAQRAGPVEVEASVREQSGRVIWQAIWDLHTLTAHQRQRYQADWTPARELPAGAYHLDIRVIQPDGAAVASQQLDFTLARPKLATGLGPDDHPVLITGSASFVRNIRAGLDLLRDRSPADYAIVTTYVTEIREGTQNWAWSGSTLIQISTTSAAHSRGYSGSIVLHEAVHVKNWATGNHPVFGCDGEAKSLTAQADFLERVEEYGLASWIRGLIGTWC